jgi:excinuclease ABC subunit B
VLDADKEGFLRSETTLIQICGRAARNVGGEVVLYADVMTGSMERAIGEMSRRRAKQLAYNKEHGITPKTIIKAIKDLNEFQHQAKAQNLTSFLGEKENLLRDPKQLPTIVKELEAQMRAAAEVLDFESAAVLRDKLKEIQQMRAKPTRG